MTKVVRRTYTCKEKRPRQSGAGSPSMNINIDPASNLVLASKVISACVDSHGLYLLKDNIITFEICFEGSLIAWY